MLIDLQFRVNGKTHSLSVPSNRMLSELLRQDLNLTGCRVACDGEVCGACTVVVDGEPTSACSTFAFQIDGCSVETIEGLSNAGDLNPIQQAFLETNAFQCGFCTAGFMMSVMALLTQQPDADDETILRWLKSNICRCTGYQTILAATRLAASRMKVTA